MAVYFPIDMTVGASKGGRRKDRSKDSGKDSGKGNVCSKIGMDFTGAKYKAGKRVLATCGLSDKTKLAKKLNAAGIKASVTSYSEAKGHLPRAINRHTGLAIPDYQVVVAQRPDGRSVIVNPNALPWWVMKALGANKRTITSAKFMSQFNKLGTGKAGGRYGKRTSAGREVGATEGDGDGKGWPWGWIVGSLAVGIGGTLAVEYFMKKK